MSGAPSLPLPLPRLMTPLEERIGSREARVVVVGAGYVGLPLCAEIAAAGFGTIALEKNPDRVRAINAGSSYIGDVDSARLEALVRSGKLAAAADADVLRAADVIVICVPTPLNKTRDPDNSFVIEAADLIAPRMERQQLIVLESTTFPGFTREVLLPRLLGGSGSGSGAGSGSSRALDQDFFLAFSPERVDPGNTTFVIRNTPKVIGGSSAASLEAAVSFYGTFVERVVPVSSTDVAEISKLLENTFRAVNIGLVNEIALMCRRLGLSAWEVIGAAATKPFGFMPFFPGPGLGGHCLPVDPLYLSWKMKTLKVDARFIALAEEVNGAMPAFVVQRVADAMNDRKQVLNGSRILLSGITYKRDVADLRESPALDIFELLLARGARVDYFDTHVPSVQVGGRNRQSVRFDEAGQYDCVVIVTDHQDVDYAGLVERARLVVDCRNATRQLRDRHPGKIVEM